MLFDQVFRIAAALRGLKIFFILKENNAKIFMARDNISPLSINAQPGVLSRTGISRQ